MNSKTQQWQAPDRPQWLSALNSEGAGMNLSAIVPLDEVSLLNSAKAETALNDFGDELWREPFQILIKALEEEAELHLMGRIMARSDLLTWLKNRLLITQTLKQHPQILEQEIEQPLFIFGLPRSGTSILFELLSQDDNYGVPQMWEAMIPCPPPQSSSYASDPRVERVHHQVTQWGRVVPEFNTMHEMGGRIPAECGLITANTFISDHIASLHQTPSYSAFFASADLTPVYQYHKNILKILQWKNPRQRWLLKAPEHQNHLDTLLKVYPDAQLIQTHRDPIKSMASSTNLLGSLYWMRSDKAFDSTAFEDIILGQATASRLEHVMGQRENGVVPESSIADSRYQDLINDPMKCIEGIYQHFNLELRDSTRDAMLAYLANKPKGKFGAHNYQVDQGSVSKERAYFDRYQRHYNVPNEV